MKTDLTRIPPKSLGPVARAIATGDEKYKEGDWIERDSRDDIRGALGHIFEFIGGRDIDDDSGEHVLAHAAARLLFILERQERGLEVGSWREVETLPPGAEESTYESRPSSTVLFCPGCLLIRPISDLEITLSDPDEFRCPKCHSSMELRCQEPGEITPKPETEKT